MIRVVVAAALTALTVTVAVAQSNPIAARKATMKAISDQHRVASEMIDGKRPFELATAKRVLASLAEHAGKMPALFPDDSKTGDTRALPAIWDNKADFDARIAKFVSDAKTGEAQASTLDAFKAQVGELRQNCNSCHDTYRKRS